MERQLSPHLITALIGVALTAELLAQTTSFTYQGRFAVNGVPATGLYEFEFTLYDSSGGLTVVAARARAECIPSAAQLVNRMRASRQ